MYAVWLFDIVLVLVLIGYTVYGFRTGLVHALFALFGLLVGAAVAFFVVPMVGNWLAASPWRVLVVIVVAIALVLGGHAGGVAVGTALGRKVSTTSVGVADRLLGAITNVMATALVLSLLASSVASFGIPLFSRTIADSAVLRVIGTATPDPVESFFAQLRSTLVQDGLPRITEALGGIVDAPILPEASTGSSQLDAAAQSVVRITGTAAACQQNQAGSGFIVADDRVVTNAHVVSGVSEPVIETLSGQVLTGTIVYFDPIDDLAVIAVPGLNPAPLGLSDTLPKDARGVVSGYPFGGPFVSSAAEVLAVNTAVVDDIYHESSNAREVYSLATTVNEGGSGGPLLTETGMVAGVVFAKSADTENLAYAMTMSELDPVAAQAPSLSSEVAAGRCTRG